MNYVAYGGGLNSTTLILLLLKLEIPIHCITFADTGGEKPETYEYIEYFNAYLKKLGLTIVTIKKGGIQETLEENCLRSHSVPSIAYGFRKKKGFRKCSQKYKRQPQDTFRNNHKGCKLAWERGEKVNVYIGFDADEPHRANRVAKEDKKYIHHYPLIEYNMGRKACEKFILEQGLLVPPKSSCFFCPATKVHEIKYLHRVHPELLKRAIRIEENANLLVIKGLGGSWSWGKLSDYLNRQQDFLTQHEDFDYEQITPCECYD